MSEQDDATSAALLRRRRRNVTGGRSKKIEVKVTQAEREKLRAAAEHAGVSVQRLMVARALAAPSGSAPVGREEKVAAWQQAVAMRNLIAAIGNNMNQIARQANSEESIPAEFGAACAGVDRALERVTAAFNEVFNAAETRVDG